MAKRLIKIAKELNVGLSTIVDFLHSKGYEIESKPTAPVSEEMHDELLKEFQNAMAVKEMADQLIIGKRTEKSEISESRAKLEDKLHELLPDLPVSEPKKEAKKEEKKEGKPKLEDLIPTEVDEELKPKVKVVGKIELEPKKEEKKEEEPEKVEEEVKAEEPATEEITPDEATEEPEEGETEADEEVVKHDAPQLQGLKIMGKIDSSKLKQPKKKKKEEKPAVVEGKKAKDKAKGKPAPSEDTDRRRRKRKRKKITQRDLEKERKKRRAKQKEEHKEISAKEIEERMKATMARLGGGGKHKRQKLRRDKRESIREKQELSEMERLDTKLQVTEFISVSDLANLMDVSPTQVITTCMNLGVIVSINQRLDAELIELLADEFGHEIEFISAEEQVDTEDEIVDAEEDLEPRAPIVTVMGHVDHGKTSLLDYIREENVASGEAGGITQHIGAYEVYVGEEKKKIAFLDTPGHEAFTAMRARGAKVTDIAVIIVAADDRIMPQTKEAISHAQAAGVPLVFAINKIDKPGADPERIKQELANMNLLVEDWGGKYQSQDISAKTGQNIAELLEKILLEAELLDLKANPNRRAYGTVIEASLDKGRGYVTKILIENGSLKIGDALLAGEFSGRVKAMFNEWGKKLKKAGPATPVLILGLSGAPQAGENFKVMATEQEAKSLANKRSQILREQNTRASKRISLDEIGRRLALGTFKELNLIVKGDVDGSVEALSDSLIKLTQQTVQVKVIHKAVGQIAESDVLLASASDAIIIGFQVRPSMGARNLAEKEGVQIKHYSIIYEAIEEVKMAIEGMLEPTKEEKITANVEVREVYKISRIGTVAGCFVHEGKITRNSSIRLIRDGIVIFPTKAGAVGEISSLKRFKDDVREVKNGLECGITIKNFNDIKVGDMIEAYEIIEIKQKLEF